VQRVLDAVGCARLDTASNCAAAARLGGVAVKIRNPLTPRPQRKGDRLATPPPEQRDVACAQASTNGAARARSRVSVLCRPIATADTWY